MVIQTVSDNMQMSITTNELMKKSAWLMTSICCRVVDAGCQNEMLIFWSPKLA